MAQRRPFEAREKRITNVRRRLDAVRADLHRTQSDASGFEGVIDAVRKLELILDPEELKQSRRVPKLHNAQGRALFRDH